MDEIAIKRGDFINGAEVIMVLKDPYIKGQIDIFVNEFEDDFFGDRCFKKYIIKKSEGEDG